MVSDIDNYFLNIDEPAQGCLLAIRNHLLSFGNDTIVEAWKYRMPFYIYKGKMFCYLWVNKDSGKPYIGFVNGKLMHHPLLLAEKRSRMKILLVDPLEDLPLATINDLIKLAMSVHK